MDLKCSSKSDNRFSSSLLRPVFMAPVRLVTGKLFSRASISFVTEYPALDDVWEGVTKTWWEHQRKLLTITNNQD